MIVRSCYTFKVIPAVHQKYQIEGFFWNQKTQCLEPLSASSQSTPRQMKIAFGKIISFSKLDDETLEISNEAGEVLHLKLGNLKPLLDTEDSHMKKALLQVYEQGIILVVKVLSSLRDEFETLGCENDDQKAGGDGSGTNIVKLNEDSDNYYGSFD